MYETLEITGEGGRRFALVLPRDKGVYTAGVAAVALRNNDYHQTSHVGVLALDYLNRAGSLIDVGANIGLLAIPAAVYGSNVVAIELLPENGVCLDLAVLANRLDNIRVFHMAAGDGRRIVGFAGSEAGGHVVAPDDAPSAVMLTLDDIVGLVDRKRFLKRPVLIKIDTEGYELDVLRGAAGIIARYDPAFIVECVTVEGREAASDRRTQQVKRLLQENGYHLYLHRERRLAPRRAGDLQEGHVCDFLAARKAYREGDRIGRFVVAPLSPAESTRWIGEMAVFPEAAHRLHAIGVIARRAGEGSLAPELAALARSLAADADAAVASHAARRLGPAGVL